MDGGGLNYRGDSSLNVPIISDRLAVRAVVGYQNKGGWIDKPNDRNANDSEVQNYRIRVKAQPADALTIDLIASNYHSHADAPNSSFPDLTTQSSAAEPLIQDYDTLRSEEHTSELQSLMRISYATFCLKTKTRIH